MDRSPEVVDLYIADISTRLPGSRRTRARLLTEIADHFEDAVASNLAAGLPAVDAERRALESLGPPSTLAEAWAARCSRLRSRQRRRIATLVGTAAVAAVLGVAQHADGHRDPARPSPACFTPSSGAHDRCR